MNFEKVIKILKIFNKDFGNRKLFNQATHYLNFLSNYDTVLIERELELISFCIPEDTDIQYSISALGSLILVALLFTTKFVLKYILAALKRLYHIRAIYHTWEKNRALPLTLEEMQSLNISSLEEYFSFLTSYVKSTLISKSSYYIINNKVFLTLEQFFDFEKSMFDLFTLAKRNEDFVVNDESNLSDLKKIEYKKFVNMLKDLMKTLILIYTL